MIKIDKITVKNFKNIDSAELEFNNYNLIVGVNNSGKSNFLKILQILDFFINGSVTDVKKYFEGEFYFRFLWGGINPSAYPDGETEIGIKFSEKELSINYSYTIIIQLTTSRKDKNILSPRVVNYSIRQEELSFKQSNKPGKAISVFSRSGKEVNFGKEFSKTEILEEVKDHISVIRLLNLLPEKNNPYQNVLSALNYIIKTPIFYFSNFGLRGNNDTKDYFGRTVSYNVENAIINLEKTNKFEILKSILKNILNIHDISIFKFNNELGRKEENIIFYSHFNNSKHFSEFSDGSILIISLITKILSSEHSIFLIEEPENSLHPKALVELNKFIKSFLGEKQFIIATHSLTLLNITDPHDVIISRIQENGMSEFTNVSNEKEMIRKLKQGYMDFSDFILFEKEPINEFEE